MSSSLFADVDESKGVVESNYVCRCKVKGVAAEE